MKPTPLSPTVKLSVKKIVVEMESHAKESIALCMRDKATQNGYGTLLALIADMKESLPRNMYLATLVHYGYSYITALQIADITDDRSGFLAAMSMLEESLRFQAPLCGCGEESVLVDRGVYKCHTCKNLS